MRLPSIFQSTRRHYFCIYLFAFLRFKYRCIFCVLLIIFATSLYILYIPYDFTIGALTSVYSRCGRKSFIFDSNGEYEFFRQTGLNDGAHCENSTFTEDFKVLTSRPPWLGVVERRIVAYSAYHIDRENVIRVLVLKHTDECRPVMCHFRGGGGGAIRGNSRKELSDNGSVSLYLPTFGTYDLIRLDCWWDCDYFESFFIDCPAPAIPIDDVVDSVNIVPMEFTACVFSADQYASAFPGIPVKRITSAERVSAPRYQHNLTMCIGPIFDWEDSLKFVLFVEYYRFQGATQFLVYHRSWSSDVQRVIDWYIHQSDIDLEVVEWPLLPGMFNLTGEELNQLNKHVSYNGQVLAMNDCGLRARGKARFVAHVDVDEFILPFPPNWPGGDSDPPLGPTLVSLLHELDRPHVGSFIFEHVRLYSNVAPLASAAVESRRNDQLFSAKRAILIRPHTSLVNHFPSRTKSVVKPEAILRQGIHFVWTHQPGYKKMIVPNERALFYHTTSLDGLPESERTSQTNQGADVALLRRVMREIESSVNAVMRSSKVSSPSGE